MSARRRISWSAALADMRRDRVAVPAGFLSARGHVSIFVRFHRPLVAAGAFDRSAIMAAATRAARQHQDRTGSTWAEAMSVSLKAAWSVARRARAN